MQRQLPIDRHGAVGDLVTCALVDDRGVVDWLPTPHLESTGAFASILDAADGGHFSISPVGDAETTQRYLDRTNVLETRVTTESGELVLTDFMPVSPEDGDGGAEGGDAGGADADGDADSGRVSPGHYDDDCRGLFRKVTGVEGSVDVELEFRPRFDFGRAETTVESADEGVLARGDDRQLSLVGDADFAVDDAGTTATATIPVEAGETRWFAVRWPARGDDGPLPTTLDAERCERRLETTADYWSDWAHDCDGVCDFDGPWHDDLVRAGLVLKLLTHRKTGAIAAAATTSLPEDVGGVRNWDYRFAWLRDVALTVQALATLGHTAEANAYQNWFLDLGRDYGPEDMQPLYSLHGERDLSEQTLDELAGYRGSKPVRVGNAASDQVQHDIYGELVLALEAAHRDAGPDDEVWEAIYDVVEYVCEVWDEPDDGIWEVRGDSRHFVHSKVMCWVAVDRALTMADRWDCEAPVDRWRDVRDDIKSDVLDRGYDEDVGSFTQSYGDDALDSAALLFPLVGFLPSDDERIQNTIDAVWDRLDAGDGLLYRYDGDDGLPGQEGAFLICTGWLVAALALADRTDEARDVLLALLDRAGPTGLFAEEIDPETGQHLGNYPQAFSHVGVVTAALYLCQAEHEDETLDAFEARVGDGAW